MLNIAEQSSPLGAAPGATQWHWQEGIPKGERISASIFLRRSQKTLLKHGENMSKAQTRYAGTSARRGGARGERLTQEGQAGASMSYPLAGSQRSCAELCGSQVTTNQSRLEASDTDSTDDSCNVHTRSHQSMFYIPDRKCKSKEQPNC